MVKSILGYPPNKKQKNRVPKKGVVKNEKNLSCSKLPEMARKLVGNVFFGFLTPLYTKRKFEKVLDDKK